MPPRSCSHAEPHFVAVPAVDSPPSPSQGELVWDGAGALASFLCLIHCAGIPVVLAIFPNLNFGFFQAESFHKIGAVVASVFALSAFGRGYLTHHARSVVGLGVLGSIFLAIAAWAPDASTLHRWETQVTIAGSLILIGAHLRNLRLLGRLSFGGHSAHDGHGH